MERLRKECEEAYQEVVRQLDPLEGTEYAGIADEIKIGLHNRLQDIVSSVASMRDDECVKGDYKGVEFLKINGEKFRIACIATCNTGEGKRALGTVGVAWGEKLDWNTGMRVQVNKVNNKTTKIWGILLAMRVGLARKYERVLIVMEDHVSARKILEELMSGKLDDCEGYETLAVKFKEYQEKGIVVQAAGEVEHASVMASAKQTFKVAEKEAKKALEIAKKEMKKTG